MSDVVIRIKRPEGYEEVVPELVVHDFIQTAKSDIAWEWVLPPSYAEQKEACAKVADDFAADLESRMKDQDWKENITGIQVVKAYRAIAQMIRNPSPRHVRNQESGHD